MFCAAMALMPMMPFMGVRISWLMRLKNSLFARFAASARLRAASASVFARSKARSLLRMVA